MADNFSGIAKFAAALSGRDRIRQEAERDARRGLKQIAEGEIAADEFRSRGTLADELIAAKVSPEDARILSAVFRSGAGNFQQGTAGVQNLFDLATGRQVQQIAGEENPDLRKVNILLSGRTSGGGPLSPQEGAVVPLGEAMVESERAQAQQRQAAAMANAARASLSGSQATAADALAALRGRTDPNIRVTKPGAVLQTTSPDLPLGEVLGGVNAIEQDAGVTLTPEQRQTFSETGSVTLPPVGPVFHGDAFDRVKAREAAANAIPPAARAKLKEGVVTTFGNGTKWTLRGGQPVRVE